LALRKGFLVVQQALITTHSPYILTSLNVLLYLGRLDSSTRGKSNIDTPKNCRLLPSEFNAFKIESDGNNFNFESLIDEESQLIKMAYIDEVSEQINNDLEQLIEMEMDDDLR
jgi:hypothetical protein